MIRLKSYLLVVAMLLVASACGRKGVLLYPDMLVPAVPTAVTAQQSGVAVKLQFTPPDKDRAGRPMKGVAGVKISRRAAEADQREVCRSCMDDFQLFRTLYLDHLPATTQRFGNRLIVVDSDVSVGNSYSYSIVPFTVDGLDGAPSAIAIVRVVDPLPAPIVKSESLPTEIRLKLSLQPLSVGRLLGYNLYRVSGTDDRSYLPINREPLLANEYVDSGLERGVKYRYTARVLMVLASGDIVESFESVEVEGMLLEDE